MKNTRVFLILLLIIVLAAISIIYAVRENLLGYTKIVKSVHGASQNDVPAFRQYSSAIPASSKKDITTFKQFDSSVPDVSEEMLYPEFWIKNTAKADNLIATSQEIEEYNKDNIKKHGPIVDIENYQESITLDELEKKINKLSKVPSSAMYTADGRKVDAEYYKNLTDNLNLAGLSNVNKVRYGITIRRTEMRTFPVSDRLYSSPSNHNIDRLMETAVYPIEPLVILSSSKDGQWYFAQMYNYAAWIPAKDVALSDNKNELFSYADRDPFLVVTGDKVYSNYNPLNSDLSEIRFDMGTRLPLASKDEVKSSLYDQNPAGNFVIKVPSADKSGKLIFDYVLISRSADVSLGYLPYTKSNIIKEAFKMQGERYGWGGTFNGRDCTSFIMDIFRTMGVKLPRNSEEQGQQAVGIYYEMPSRMTLSERKSIFDKMEPGTGLYMNGHAMLYLGKYNDEYYIIHDFSGYSVQNNGKTSQYTSWEVAVTPLSIRLSSGKTYMEGLYGAREFVPEK